MSAMFSLAKSWGLSGGDGRFGLRATLLLLTVLYVTAVHAFTGGLSASPNPNTGDYTVSWTYPTNSYYTLQELPSGGTWTNVVTATGSSWSTTGKAPGTYTYRLRYHKIECSGFPEPECFPVTTYSTDQVVVTVNEQSSGGGEDPFPPPGTFTPPDSTDFPNAAIVGPSIPTGDYGLNSVGALVGSGGVSGGQATYSIPIVVPPGRKGMQPNVSLNYSSSSGNGIAGVGWGLSATSAISRCSATPAQDGFTAAVQYDAVRDRLCLDGRRLVVVSGTYGANGAEYRTELDIFARVKQYGGINSSTSYFTVEYKDGRKSWFGNNTNTRHKAAGRSEILTWAVHRTDDPSKNTIKFQYFDHGHGEHNVSWIKYTGYNGSEGDRQIDFTYEDRPDIRFSYLAGGKSQRRKRLTKISTKYAGAVVREYTLDYGQSESASSGRSLLRSVEECAYKDSVKNCFPVTAFEWQEQAPQYGVSGSGEQLYYFDGSQKVGMHGATRWLDHAIPNGDANGDGVKDWPNVFLNAEGQKTNAAMAAVVANCFKPINSFVLKCLQMDFNSDGITDSFRENNNKFEVSATNPSGGYSWINTGIDWDPSGLGLADFPLGFADFNGDGWIDVAFVQHDDLWVYFHTKSLTAPYSNTNRQLIHTYSISTGSTRNEEVQITGDMDGNGTPDFVLSTLGGANEPPGLPKPTSILLTESGTGGSMSTTSRAITNHVVSDFVNSHFFHDLNGDGLVDLLALEDGLSGNLVYRLNKGTDFETSWTSLGISLPTRSGSWWHAGDSTFYPYRIPVMSKVLTIDYDGDGRDELLVARGVVASSCAFILSAGTSGSWLCDDALYGEFQASVTSHIGTQINAAIADDSIRSYNLISFSQNASGVFSSSEVTTNIEASASQTAVIDATGDGLPDILTMVGCRGDSSGCKFNDESPSYGGSVTSTKYDAQSEEGAWIYRNIGVATDIPAPTNYEFEYGANDVMSAAEDAFGNRSEWTYRPLSSDAYRTAGGDDYYTVDHSVQASDPDHFYFASSMNVVADYRSSNGIGGLNSTKYRYEGAIYNNKGRGFQGFLAIVTEEDVYASAHALADRDKISRTEFHQKWPKSSIVSQSCTWLATDSVATNPSCSTISSANKLISKSYTDLIHNVVTVGGARFVAIDTNTVKSYDLGSRSLMTTQVTNRSFDSYGNITSVSSSHVDDWTSNSSLVTRTFAAANLTNWWINRLSSETTTHNPVSLRHASTPSVSSSQDQTKTLTKTYNTYDTTHRFPTNITTTANDSSLSLVVDSNYNSYGLPNWSEVSGTDVVGPRRTTYTYTKTGSAQESDGYFPYTVENALGHTTTSTYDPAHGTNLTTTDPNGLVATTVYDAFGREWEVTPPGSPTVYTRLHWCDGSPSCTPNAVYRVHISSAGAPIQLSYIDQAGRAEYTYHRNHSDNGWVRVRTQFDERGNVTYEHRPWDPVDGESMNQGTRYTSYDALNRLLAKETDQANGTALSVTYTHSDFTTTIYAGGIFMERTYDGLGKLVETKDGDGYYTRYAYDGAGNPIVIADPKMLSMSNVIGIRAEFNAFGHKEWVEDPDWWNNSAGTHGVKTFTYNALGEVLSETDPKGDVVEMEYDELGRMTDRLVNGNLNGKWHYDNTDMYKGLGLLDFEDSQFRADGSRHQKFYYYSNSTTGRKDLLQVTHRFYENDDQNDFQTYDMQYFTDTYYARPKGVRFPGTTATNGTAVAYEYNSVGIRTKEKDPTSSVIYREVTELNSFGSIAAANVGYHGSWKYGVTTNHYDQTGQVQSIAVTANGSALQTLNYTYDNFGNLNTRSTNIGNGNTETFGYDNLQRLTSSLRTSAGSGSASINYSYDASGNFQSKGDVGTYTYHSSRPHVLLTAGTNSYSHDENGNITSRAGTTISYNAFNKPESISGASPDTTFTYGADLMRYRQHVDPTSGTEKTVYYVGKSMEIETVGTTTSYRHYLGDVAILTKTGSLSDSNPDIKYTFRDRLGGVSALGDTSGSSTETRGYDAFGKPRDGDWTDKSPPIIGSTVTDRGFTDHEHLDDWALIHMNGRGYDYSIGRFLSVDPLIQEPGNSQSINGFAYIMNNPLSGTDPTGYKGQSKIAKAQESTRSKWADKNGQRGGSGIATSISYYGIPRRGVQQQQPQQNNGASESAPSDPPGNGTGTDTTETNSNQNQQNTNGVAGGSDSEPDPNWLPDHVWELLRNEEFLEAARNGRDAAAASSTRVAKGETRIPTMGDPNPNEVVPHHEYAEGAIIRKDFWGDGYSVDLGDIGRFVVNGNQTREPNPLKRWFGMEGIHERMIEKAAGVVLIIPPGGYTSPGFKQTKFTFSQHEPLFPVITVFGNETYVTYGDLGPIEFDLGD